MRKKWSFEIALGNFKQMHLVMVGTTKNFSYFLRLFGIVSGVIRFSGAWSLFVVEIIIGDLEKIVYMKQC